MTGFARARGLVWALPGIVLAVVGAAGLGRWIAARAEFDQTGRVPAVVLGALAVSVLATAVLHRADEEVDGSTTRPTAEAELGLVLAGVLLAGVLAVLLLPDHQFERGGLELARDSAGLTGLALLGATLAGPRLAWVAPFAWAATSYFAVPRTYGGGPWSVAGWLMFPATWGTTWLVAVGLLVAGVAAYGWGGGAPRPLAHPLRRLA